VRSFDGVDIALFSAGGSISKKFGPLASDAGATVSGIGRSNMPCDTVYAQCIAFAKCRFHANGSVVPDWMHTMCECMNTLRFGLAVSRSWTTAQRSG